MTDNNPENPTLSKNQLRAIPLILSARNLAEGARKAKVSRDTVYEWMKQPAFKEELDRKQKENVEAALRSLKSAISEATEVLRALLKDTKEGTRLKAAQIIIEAALKAQELDDIEKRIIALEKQIKIRPK